jgi:uncharacterized protein YndB with AHSA1/START domain
MVDILHRIGIEGRSADDVFDALATRDGLAGWWSEQVEGDSALGDVVTFRFVADGVEIGTIGVKVIELVPAKLVRWEVVDGPPEWNGTTIAFELTQADDWTIVLFSHTGWAEPVEFMHHCSTKWATFLVSLKELVETGTGSPSPRDLQISDWH